MLSGYRSSYSRSVWGSLDATDATSLSPVSPALAVPKRPLLSRFFVVLPAWRVGTRVRARTHMAAGKQHEPLIMCQIKQNLEKSGTTKHTNQHRLSRVISSDHHNKNSKLNWLWPSAGEWTKALAEGNNTFIHRFVGRVDVQPKRVIGCRGHADFNQ